ncbi:MAG TPA: hypothetical protein DEA67_09100 [Selenomonas sp.]|nr:hypothetical protein [Selenomonas sp.]
MIAHAAVRADELILARSLRPLLLRSLIIFLFLFRCIVEDTFEEVVHGHILALRREKIAAIVSRTVLAEMLLHPPFRAEQRNLYHGLVAAAIIT